MKVNVVALLTRLDEVWPRTDIPPHRGRWLADRWWKLEVSVISDHRYRGNDVWQPGIYIDCCDPEGRFSTRDFVEFDQCWLTESQIHRMDAFIDRWQQSDQQVGRPRRRNPAAAAPAGDSSPSLPDDRPSRWPPKRRNFSSDSLANDRAEWDTLPDSTEQAYRRGFVQDAAQAVYAFQDGISCREIERWVFGRV